MYNKTLMWICTLIFLVFISCAEIQQVLQMANIQKPTAHVSDVKISGISFKDIALVFDIQINNPNAVGVHLDGFDYDFLLSGSSFVKGDQNQGVDIVSHGSSVVSLPVTLAFSEIYNVYKSVQDQDEIGYQLNTGLIFNLPVLGLTRIPIESSGKIPAVKIPSVKLGALSVKKMGFTSVDLEAVINLSNPNNFDLNLNKFNYTLNINGQQWVTGTKNSAITLNRKGESAVTVPISLNILSMGQTVLNMINGGARLDYQFSGGAEVGSSLEMFGVQPLSFDKSGDISIVK